MNISSRESTIVIDNGININVYMRRGRYGATSRGEQVWTLGIGIGKSVIVNSAMSGFRGGRGGGRGTPRGGGRGGGRGVRVADLLVGQRSPFVLSWMVSSSCLHEEHVGEG